MEHSSFTQLVFSTTGGMAKVATGFYKRLALCLAVNWDYPCSFLPCPGCSGGFREGKGGANAPPFGG